MVSGNRRCKSKFGIVIGRARKQIKQGDIQHLSSVCTSNLSQDFSATCVCVSSGYGNGKRLDFLGFFSLWKDIMGWWASGAIDIASSLRICTVGI